MLPRLLHTMTADRSTIRPLSNEANMVGVNSPSSMSLRAVLPSLVVENCISAQKVHFLSYHTPLPTKDTRKKHDFGTPCILGKEFDPLNLPG
mmetsp:Transcript_16425/g.31146  ORF Transcript_16425/g.31146 Transcript_16425/m.31146 type:complete len:92 (-) Transcript_16425:109-384(-)